MSNIKSVKSIGKYQTYDLEVDHTDHQFYLANGVLTSNSHATAYAFDSFYCSWLFTYYPDEWLTSYLDSVSSPEDKALAFAQVKEYGYKVSSYDVNYSGHSWTCVSNKKLFVPSLEACKGIGQAAVAELLALRPFNDIETMLYNDDGTWRFTKFNKKGMEVLVKLRAFESLDCVGEGKLFKSYKGMHAVIIENNDLIRHRKRNDPQEGRKHFFELARTIGQCDEWTKQELAQHTLDILGAVDVGVLVESSVFEKLDAKGVKSINECVEGQPADLYWMIPLTGGIVKKTKNNKNYVEIEAIGATSKPVKIKLWGGNKLLNPLSLYVAECDRNNFGISSKIFKCKEVTT